MYLSTNQAKEYAIEFVGEQIPVRASRQLPCVFNLYEPKHARLVMYPGIEDKGVPFFPRTFLNHAFEPTYNPFSPVLFWYKVLNYKGLQEFSLNAFSPNLFVLFHEKRYTLLHYFAYHNREDLMKAALEKKAPLLIDQDDESALSIALKRKSMPCVKVMLAHLCSDSQNPLFDNISVIELSQIEIPSLPFEGATKAFLSLDVDAQ